MSRSAQSPNNWFFFVAGGTVVAASLVGLLVWGQLQDYRYNRAAGYARAASSETSPERAVNNYRLALALDPNNVKYRGRLADQYEELGEQNQAVEVLGDTEGERLRKATLQMLLGRFDAALATVKPLSSSSGAIMRSEIYLEQGRGDQAIGAVNPGTSEQEKIQLMLSYMGVGDSEKAQKLVGEGASQELRAAQYGGLVLAQQLYNRQLYRSCLRVVGRMGQLSAAQELLAAQAYARELPQTNETLAEAQRYAQKGLEIDPSNPTLHRFLLEIDRKLNDQEGVRQQTDLISRLDAGKL